MRIIEGVYWYPWRGRGNNCNSYLLAGEKRVLIDPGHIYNEFRESCLKHLVASMAADGFKPEEIDLILCTHGHPDHCQAAGQLREQSGARLAMHREDLFFLDYVKQVSRKDGGQGSPSLEPDFYLQEGELELGNDDPLKIEVIHTPGHSPGGACFYLPGQGVLITGDTVFERSIGRADLPGGDMALLEQSVARLAALENAELLLPGHMNMISGKEKVRQNFELIGKLFF